MRIWGVRRFRLSVLRRRRNRDVTFVLANRDGGFGRSRRLCGEVSQQLDVRRTGVRGDSRRKGVLIVSRPGTIHFSFSLFLLFLGAFILAVNVILIRRYASNQSSIAFAFYGFLVGLIISAIITTQFYVPLKNNDIYIFILCGIIAGSGGLCISAASKMLESSLFAPLQYFQLIAGFVFGYLFFGDVPDYYELIGSLVISVSGLFIIYRDYQTGIKSFTSKVRASNDIINRGN